MNYRQKGKRVSGCYRHRKPFAHRLRRSACQALKQARESVLVNDYSPEANTGCGTRYLGRSQTGYVEHELPVGGDGGSFDRSVAVLAVV
jgi:hypothetical protein